MIKKQLVLLKIVVSKHDNHRLVLLNYDFETLVKGKKLSTMKIELDDTAVIDFTKSMTNYTEEGELAQRGRISTWIEKNGFLTDADKVLLLFELTIDEKNAAHSYRYLGDANELGRKISEAQKL